MVRNFSRLLFSLAATLVLAACSPSGGPDEAAAPASAERPEGQAYRIAVVPKGLGHQFWNTVRAGAEAAGKELNAEILWNGPAKETELAKQINILEDMMSRGVDAIVMAACDENALIPTIESAMAKGIPVVTIDSGVKSDLPVSFIATDNVAGAAAAADTLAGLLGGAGKVGLIPFVSGAATSEQREAGFKQGLEKHAGVALVSTIYCDSDVAKAVAATEDMLTKHPDLGGIFAANEAACIGAISALEAAGKKGQVKLVAFDASKEQIDGLRSGAVQALIVQKPFRMGYDGVATAIAHLQGNEVSKRVDTGVTVVTPENIDSPEVQELLNPTL